MLSSSIREGSDIYFVCHVDAIPSVKEITWLHNETPINESNYLETKPDGGQIIISNNSLVLQRVNMHKRGKYACVASNSEGTGESNRIELRVLRKLATFTGLNEQKRSLPPTPKRLHTSYQTNKLDSTDLPSDQLSFSLISQNSATTGNRCTRLPRDGLARSRTFVCRRDLVSRVV